MVTIKIGGFYKDIKKADPKQLAISDMFGSAIWYLYGIKPSPIDIKCL